MGSEPYLVKWLRYSAFLPLYPLGVASELTMAFLALPGIAERRPWSWTMPNPLNFALDYHVACWVVIALYLPGGGCVGLRGAVRGCAAVGLWGCGRGCCGACAALGGMCVLHLGLVRCGDGCWATCVDAVTRWWCGAAALWR
jgi:hypothetical protein